MIKNKNRQDVILPDNYWETIIQFFPGYYQDNDIHHSDRLQCLVDGEIVDEEEEKELLDEYGTLKKAEIGLHKLNVELYIQAMQAKHEEDIEKDTCRICDHCGSFMKEGFCHAGGESYYCSEKCLSNYFTKKTWKELYNNGNGDSYYTAWEGGVAKSNFKDMMENDSRFKEFIKSRRRLTATQMKEQYNVDTYKSKDAYCYGNGYYIEIQDGTGESLDSFTVTFLREGREFYILEDAELWFWNQFVGPETE